jgi:hypothetical protein
MTTVPVLDLGADDGLLDVTIGGVTQRIDAYETHDKLYEIAKEFQDKPSHEYHAAIVELLKAFGFPPCSHRAADRFTVAIIAHIGELKKKADGAGTVTPSSPASTA